jgi:predicted transcriptional regulator
MLKTPCEQFQYDLLPTIRKELANCLIGVFKLSQRQAALKIGITPSAISQYKHKKRADNKNNFSNEIMMEIVESARRIYDKDVTIAEKEICRLCIFVRAKQDNNHRID